MNELDTGYSVVIGNPLINAEKKATGSSVSIPCDVISDGSYLVTLEVNGTIIAYRESLEFSSGSCTVGDYTLSYSSYALTVSGTSNNNIVRVMVEPLEVKTTDAFRAAVKKDTPATPNELPAVTDVDEGKVLTVNNSGVWGAQEPSGGQFIITVTSQGGGWYAMDKTKDEVIAAYERGDVLLGRYGNIDYVYIGRYRFGSQNILYFQSAEMAYFEQVLTIDLVSGDVDLGSASQMNGYVTVNNLAPSNKKNTFLHVNQYNSLDFVDLSPFIVTLTPTAADYSGTMDKTVAEINAAYEAGREIWFKIYAGSSWTEYPLSRVGKEDVITYPSFNSNALYDENNVLVMIYTETTNDGTKQTYSTKIYTLTPAT